MKIGCGTGLLLALVVFASNLLPAEEPSLVERLGYPRNAKLLIVHADDVGMCHGVNVATVEAMTKGWVSSASIMVPCPWFPEAVELARANPKLDFGLHLTLNSKWRYYKWGPVTPRDQVRSLVDGEGFLRRSYIETLGFAAAEDVEKEIRAQVQRALEFGLHPTHLDSHMGTLFMSYDYFNAYRKVAHEFKIPYLVPEPALHWIEKFDPRRRIATAATMKEIKAAGDIVINDVVMGIEASTEKRTRAYVDVIRNLKPGVTEILMHCGNDSEELKAITHSWAHRAADARAFMDPVVKQAMDEAGVRLIGWATLKKLQYGK